MNNRSGPLVSVIVPVYNQEKFIGRCLRSLIHQSFPREDYEIITVDDGSIDRTPFALSLFHDAIRIVTQEKNQGLAASLNRGISESSAPFVVRVDSDDYVNFNFISFLHLFLDQNPDLDAVACDYWISDEGDAWLERKNCLEDPIACGIMFRREQLLEIGLYDESFRVHEERDLRIRFEEQYRIHRLQLPLYRYLRHGNNLTDNTEQANFHYTRLLNKHGSRAHVRGSPKTRSKDDVAQ